MINIDENMECIEYNEYINNYLIFYNINIEFNNIFLNELNNSIESNNSIELICIELYKIAINFELLYIILDKLELLFDIGNNNLDDSLLQLYILDIFSFITNNLNSIIHNKVIIDKIEFNNIFELLYNLNIETLIEYVDDVDCYKNKLILIIEQQKKSIKNEFTEILNNVLSYFN